MSDRIDFDQQEEIMEKEEERVSEVDYQTYKKSKAEKIITCYPQSSVTSATTFFDNQRFMFVNQYGTVVQKIEVNEEMSLEV